MGCSTSTLDDRKTGNTEPSINSKLLEHIDTSKELPIVQECGMCQSPIDISNNCNFGTTKMMKDEDLSSNPLRFHYPNKVKNCTIQNNGKTVQVNIGQKNKCTLSVHGKTFTLRQFHFHTPSEHLIDGKQYEMEMHLVHTSEKGEIAVLGFIFTVNPNSFRSDCEEPQPNEFLAQFWDQLPTEKTTEDIPLKKPLNFQILFENSTNNFVESTQLNQIEIDMEIYEYTGSLTTPPYTEGVQWLVSKKLHLINSKQLSELSACWNDKNNARPVQEYCGRTVFVRRQSSYDILL